MRFECGHCGAHGFSPGLCQVCFEGQKSPLEASFPAGTALATVKGVARPARRRMLRVRRAYPFSD